MAGILLAMRGSGRLTVALVLAGALLAGSSAQAADLTLAEPGGASVRWTEWIASHGPAAVLVWASWAPDGRDLVTEVAGLAAAARSKQLELVVVSVQESEDAAARELGSLNIRWLHDRHGAILKEYRIIRVPALVVIDRDATVVARLEPTERALRAWGGS